VRLCSNDAPIGGVRVRAFDVDWLQDDALATPSPTAAGIFGSTIRRLTSKKTIFSPAINIEWVGGPDLYSELRRCQGRCCWPSLRCVAERQIAKMRVHVSAWTCASKSSRPLRLSARFLTLSGATCMQRMSRVGAGVRAYERGQPRLLLDGPVEWRVVEDSERTTDGISVRVSAD